MTYRDSSCTGKNPHPSKSRAKKAMKRLARFEGKPARMYNVYRCAFCGCWHSAHSRPDIDQSRIEQDRYAEVVMLNGQ